MDSNSVRVLSSVLACAVIFTVKGIGLVSHMLVAGLITLALFLLLDSEPLAIIGGVMISAVILDDVPTFYIPYIGMVDIGVVIWLDLFLLVVNILCFGKYGCLFFFVVGLDIIAVYGTELSLLLGEVSVFGDVMFLILNFVEDTLFFTTLYGTLICTFFAGSLYLDRGSHSSES